MKKCFIAAFALHERIRLTLFVFSNSMAYFSVRHELCSFRGNFNTPLKIWWKQSWHAPVTEFNWFFSLILKESQSRHDRKKDS